MTSRCAISLDGLLALRAFIEQAEAPAIAERERLADEAAERELAPIAIAFGAPIAEPVSLELEM